MRENYLRRLSGVHLCVHACVKFWYVCVDTSCVCVCVCVGGEGVMMFMCQNICLSSRD